MTNPQDDPKPKYMCLEGKTQFEMALAIDEAMSAAELTAQQLALPTALQWWYQQFEQQIQEECLLSDMPVESEALSDKRAFIQACSALYLHIMDANSEPQNLAVTAEFLFKSSLSDTIDMMRAQGLWRFELQRAMQTLQGQVIDGFRRVSRST